MLFSKSIVSEIVVKPWQPDIENMNKGIQKKIRKFNMAIKHMALRILLQIMYMYLGTAVLWHIYLTLNFFMSSLISGSMLMVSNFGLYLLKGIPSGATRNFSKFHETSVLETGSQMMSLGSPMR